MICFFLYNYVLQRFSIAILPIPYTTQGYRNAIVLSKITF